MDRKHAFIILAYSQPDYVDSLIKSLGGGTSNRTNIYVHIDTKSITNFQHLTIKYKPYNNVHFSSKYSLHWGGYQIIDTQCVMLRMAFSDDTNFYFHLLSDSECLCRPLNELIAFFDNPQNQEKEYIECAPVKEIWSLNNIKLRFFCWNIHDYIDTRKWHLGLVNRYLCKLQWLLHIRRENFPYDILYGGSSWWTLSRRGAETLLLALENKKISKRFHFTYAPDEIFPSTVIGNSNLTIVSDYCLRNRNIDNAGIPCFRYIPWWKKGSITLDVTDYPHIKRSGAFFCRKMNRIYSKDLIKMLRHPQ